MRHLERHRTSTIGWLRATVLGANDGLISTSSLIVGIAAAEATRDPIVLAALGAVAAHLGGATLWRGAVRVAFWGVVAMGVTAFIGRLFGTALP